MTSYEARVRRRELWPYAKLRREAGESIESVSQFLDHSSLAVTTVYRRRPEGQTDESWGKVAEAIGV